MPHAVAVLLPALGQQQLVALGRVVLQRVVLFQQILDGVEVRHQRRVAGQRQRRNLGGSGPRDLDDGVAVDVVAERPPYVFVAPRLARVVDIQRVRPPVDITVGELATRPRLRLRVSIEDRRPAGRLDTGREVHLVLDNGLDKLLLALVRQQHEAFHRG